MKGLLFLSAVVYKRQGSALGTMLGKGLDLGVELHCIKLS